MYGYMFEIARVQKDLLDLEEALRYAEDDYDT